MTEKPKEGIERDLTLGEFMLAKSVFGFSIRYHNIKIHYDSYLPFGMQANRVAMAPNGELWFREGTYSNDFSMGDMMQKHLFIHEMTHVWQRQRGLWVRTRGLYSWAADYYYDFDNRDTLDQYSMEQQASIVADYWLLSEFGYEKWWGRIGHGIMFKGKSSHDISTKYQRVLSKFIKERYP